MTFTLLLLSSPPDQISLPHPFPIVGWTGADDADDADDESTHSSKLFADSLLLSESSCLSFRSGLDMSSTPVSLICFAYLTCI